jgi:hypothetical protein
MTELIQSHALGRSFGVVGSLAFIAVDPDCIVLYRCARATK